MWHCSTHEGVKIFLELWLVCGLHIHDHIQELATILEDWQRQESVFPGFLGETTMLSQKGGFKGAFCQISDEI